MIFKTWSKPTRPEIWAKYASTRSILLVIALAGNVISAYSEFMAMDTIAMGITAVLLLEGGIWFFGALFFDNLFAFAKMKDVSSAIFGIVGGLACAGIFYMSLNLSLVGKDKIVAQSTAPAVLCVTDSSKYNLLLKKGLSQLQADSLQIVAKIGQKKEAERQNLLKAQAAAGAAKQKVMSFGDYSYAKYANAIKSSDSRAASASSSLTSLNAKYESLLNSELASAKAGHNQAIVEANAALIAAMDSSATVSGKTMADWNANLAAKQYFTALLVKAGIVFSLFFLFFNGLGRHLSGSYPIYKSPFDGVLSPFERIKYGIWLHWRSLWDKLADRVTPTDAIQVVSKQFQFELPSNFDPVKVSMAGLGVSNHMPAPMPASLSPTLPNQKPKNEFSMQKTKIQPAKIEQKAVVQSFTLEPEPVQEPVKPVAVAPIANPNTEAAKTPRNFDWAEIQVEGKEVNETSAANVRERVVGFDYTKTRTNILNTYKKMRESAVGGKKKVAKFEAVASERFEKLVNWVQDLVYQGYMIEIVNGEVVIDAATEPSLKNQIVTFRDAEWIAQFGESASIYELQRKLKDFNSVRIIPAANADKFPISIEYADWSRVGDVSEIE
jgi:hypothetical protein